ncbi:hypothetical protein AAF712_016664 [Marasmius tenuissimus]|uniref:Uncharacterized protein n=1 Tax=Marasmius tenuissimus TaxID=585030 RepID=A0ABR2Z652_9AGAR
MAHAQQTPSFTDHRPPFEFFATPHLPCISEIVSGFEALGRPPTPFQVSPAVFDALRFIGALGVHARTSPSAMLAAMKPFVWNQLIEPWLKALLIMCLVTTTETSPTSREAQRDVLWFVPWCMNSFIDIPFEFALSDSTDIPYAVTSQLQYLLVRAWLEVLGKGHAASDWWSILLLKLNVNHDTDADTDTHTSVGLFDTRTLGALKLENIPAFRRYLVSMTSRLPSAEDQDLAAFAAFMYLLADIVSRARVGVLQQDAGRQEVYDMLVNDTLPLLIRLSTKILRIMKAGEDSPQEEKDECDGVEAILFCTLFILTRFLDGPCSVYRALTSGLLSAFLKHPHSLPALTPQLQYGVYSLFNIISRFMVYPAIVKEFTRAIRNGGTAFNDHMQTVSNRLSFCWQDCMAKARYVWAIREDLKAHGTLRRCAVATVGLHKISDCPL